MRLLDFFGKSRHLPIAQALNFYHAQKKLFFHSYIKFLTPNCCFSKIVSIITGSVFLMCALTCRITKNPLGSIKIFYSCSFFHRKKRKICNNDLLHINLKYSSQINYSLIKKKAFYFKSVLYIYYFYLSKQ